MVKPLIYGLTTGAVLGMTLYGPAFFLLLQLAMERGKKSGIAFSLGIILSDFAVVILLLFGLRSLFESPGFYQVFSLVGGLGLAGFALHLFFKRYNYETAPTKDFKGQWWKLLGKGFLFNIINPLAYVYWLSILATVRTQDAYGMEELLIFFGSLFMGLFLIDLIKITISSRRKPWMTPRVLHLCNQVLSLVILGFGVHLLYLFATGSPGA